eukprot:GHRQ01015980.1.p3 GENE.GHRQ01015980.1~~GHRQ01015980.1.p3  ORF type:complete len:128 (-),score=30.20 GHRQ01015980.1:1550-1933(-)
MFTGEMVFPWMFEDFAALRPYKAAADLLAAKQDWSQLYRPEVLASSQVRGSASTLWRYLLGTLQTAARAQRMPHQHDMVLLHAVMITAAAANQGHLILTLRWHPCHCFCSLRCCCYPPRCRSRLPPT